MSRFIRRAADAIIVLILGAGAGALAYLQTSDHAPPRDLQQTPLHAPGPVHP